MDKETAINLAKSGWWKGLPARQIAEFQFNEELLCMDWSDFCKAMNETLGRPVYTHEYALDREGLRKELMGERAAPTLEEIINLIPEEKRIIITA